MLRTNLHSFLDHLREATLEALRGEGSVEKVTSLADHALWTEFELAHAHCALASHLLKLAYRPLHLRAGPSGALPLFERGYFPWGALPYPREHAELGALLALLGKESGQLHLVELAQKMASWQLNTLDHYGLPIRSLFAQEKSVPYHELLLANLFLFATLGYENVAEKLRRRLEDENFESTPFSRLVDFCLERTSDAVSVSQTNHISDPHVGMVGHRTTDATLICLGGGCKSGMGAYLCGDVGVINYGPQLLPLDECAGFGLAGSDNRHQHDNEESGFVLTSQSPLAAPHPRNTGLPHLSDSGYSALWIEAEQSYTPGKLSLACRLEGIRSVASIAFVFYGLGKRCLVAGSHRLNPASQDRYTGPPDSITFEGDQGNLSIEVGHGATAMEVAPLPGGASFWGADFLVALSIDPTFNLMLKKNVA